LITKETAPGHALHAHYASEGAYVDCYTTTIDRPVVHAQYVEAFYTTWLFKLERLVLTLLVNKPSTDEQARQLAQGTRGAFAAWTVEARAHNELLVCDFLGSTRSWLCVEPRGTATKLYFGTVVVKKRRGSSARLHLGYGFTLMLPFHKLYARSLLLAARLRLKRANPPS
jgi:hypothetical protein